VAVPQHLRRNEHLQQTLCSFFDTSKQRIHDVLAPLRDYLCPKDPRSSPLLHTTKERYFGRLSVGLHPGKPGYAEARWISSEDVNAEHLLDVFTNIGSDSDGIWDVCSYFMDHLHWHRPRLVLLGPKIEALPDTHPSKPRCLFQLSRLFSLVGNYVECKRLLIYALKLWTEWGDSFEVAQTLRYLSEANRLLDLHEEGIQQVKEALEIFEQLNDTLGQARSLCGLAWLLYEDQRFDAAEDAISQSINHLPERVDQITASLCRRLLGKIHSSKGEMEKAINNFEAALRILSSLNWDYEQFWNNYDLAELFFSQGRSEDSRVHVERAKSHAVDDMYLMGRAMELQALHLYQQRRLREARSEVLCAVSAYEKVGAVMDLERCRDILHDVEEKMEDPSTSCESDSNGELLDTIICYAY